MYYNNWLLWKFGISDKFANQRGVLYGPLWELIIGSANHYIFYWLNDTSWVRNALTLALYPMTLLFTGILLRRAGYSFVTSILCVASIFGIIRIGGHSITNPKDFPLACAYLLVTLALWHLLRAAYNCRTTSQDRAVGLLGLAGVISVIPFLTRTPVITHYVLLILTVYAYTFCTKDKLHTKQKIFLVLLPAITGAITTVILYPPFWVEATVETIKEPYTYFSDYPRWHGNTKVLGVSVDAHDIPWWYVFAWIPVVVNPVMLLCSLGGVFLLFEHRNKKPTSAFVLDTDFGKRNLTLERWLLIVTVITYASLLYIRPALYDEDRHILFTYPTLFLLGALGLQHLQQKKQLLCAALIVATSIGIYGYWGKYAYVYKSELVFDRNAERFLGDYWGMCMSEAINALPGVVPEHSIVRLQGPSGVAHLQFERRKTSRRYANTKFPNYQFVGKSYSKRPFAGISINRSGYNETIKDVRKGAATLLWETHLPTGEQACVIAMYE